MRPGAGSIGTWCGTARIDATRLLRPTRCRSASPRSRRSAMGRRRAVAAAVRYASGCGLPALTSSPVTTVGEGAGGQLVDDGLRQPDVGHRDQPARNAALCQRASNSCAPGRHGTCARSRGRTTSSSSRSTIDRRVEIHSPVLADVAAGLGQRVADQRVRVLVAPLPAVRLDQRVLGGDPVRLGVDERAVHVEQHRRNDGGELHPGYSLSGR